MILLVAEFGAYEMGFVMERSSTVSGLILGVQERS